MKKYAAFIIISLMTSIILYSQEEKIKLAVSPVDDTVTEAAEKEKVGGAVSKSLEKTFTGVKRFYVRDPREISQYMDALIKVQLGLLSPDVMISSPLDLKINYLTVGTISRFDDIYEIDMRTVSIEDWKIVHSRGCTSSTVPEGIKDIAWYVTEQFTERYLAQRVNERSANPVVTVQKFKDINDDAGSIGYSGAFAEILNSELGSYALITAIERKYSKALINEKVLEMVGVVDNGSEGNLRPRGIQYYVQGDIRVFKDVICVNYTLCDSADGRIAFMGRHEIVSHHGLRPAAKSIAGTIEDVLNNRIGTLTVHSEPPEAEIMIGNEPAGKTPLTVSIGTGKHSLKAKSSGFETLVSDFEIKPREVKVLQLTLVPLSLQLLTQAYELEEKNDWAGAIAVYDEFVNKYNETEDANNALYRKGHIQLLYLKEYENALKTFENLVSRYPETMVRAEGYFGIARTYRALGKQTKSRQTLKYLLEKYGDTPAAEESRKMKL